MEDQDKILNALYQCLMFGSCSDCMYYTSFRCKRNLHNDILQLMKEKDDAIKEKDKTIDRLLNEKLEELNKEREELIFEAIQRRLFPR